MYVPFFWGGVLNHTSLRILRISIFPRSLQCLIYLSCLTYYFTSFVSLPNLTYLLIFTLWNKLLIKTVDRWSIWRSKYAINIYCLFVIYTFEIQVSTILYSSASNLAWPSIYFSTRVMNLIPIKYPYTSGGGYQPDSSDKSNG